jgi:hypothetical protein
MVKVKRKHNYDLKLNKRINFENLLHLVPQNTKYKLIYKCARWKMDEK